MAIATKAAQCEIAKAAHITKRISEKSQQWAEFLARKNGGLSVDFLADCTAKTQAESAVFAAEFDRAHPVKAAKPRVAKVKKMTFSQWYDDADMPERDENGKWRDLETGLYFNK